MLSLTVSLVPRIRDVVGSQGFGGAELWVLCAAAFRQRTL
jgi:hypothetical protein